METLEACNAAVLGINPGTLDDHQRSQAQLGLTFPLLHDPGAQVAALYGASGRRDGPPDGLPHRRPGHYSLWPPWNALERSVFERSECTRVGS